MLTAILMSAYLHAGMLSYHINRDPKTVDEWNETHNLISLEINNWHVGRYTNSYHKETIFVMRTRRVWDLDRPDMWLGVQYGLVTGYASSKVAVAPTIFIDTKPIGVNIIVGVGVNAIQFKVKI